MLLIKEKMAEVMEDKDVNCKHLMRILGVSYSCVNHYLNGRLGVPLAKARLLIEYFGAEAIAYATDWEAINASCPF